MSLESLSGLIIRVLEVNLILIFNINIQNYFVFIKSAAKQTVPGHNKHCIKLIIIIIKVIISHNIYPYKWFYCDVICN